MQIFCKNSIEGIRSVSYTHLLIKEYEKEYIEFMEIEKLPQYKIDFFEINVEESDAAGFASAAQAYYNTKTDEHILRICKSSEIPRYIVFHEFTHILDTEMYAKQDSWKYMALSGYTEYHAAQVELMIMLGADSIQTQDFSFTVDVEIGNSTVRNYLNSRHQLVAVSYTHLDVYKRQDLSRWIMLFFLQPAPAGKEWTSPEIWYPR